MTSMYMRLKGAANADAVLDAIRKRRSRNFTGAEIGAEVGLCRQSVYKHIRTLRAQGHRIQSDVALGFMAQLKREEE